MSQAPATYERPLVEKLQAAMTWGKVVFLILGALAIFTTYVIGEVSGAQSLAPRIVVLEEHAAHVTKRLELRAVEVNTKFEEQGKSLAKIEGFLMAIGKAVGAEVQR